MLVGGFGPTGLGNRGCCWLAGSRGQSEHAEESYSPHATNNDSRHFVCVKTNPLDGRTTARAKTNPPVVRFVISGKLLRRNVDPRIGLASPPRTADLGWHPACCAAYKCSREHRSR